MATIPLTWRLSVEGSESVKNRLSELNSQFSRGEVSAEDYAKGLRGVNRDARSLSGIMQTQRNIFLATHPAVNALSRGMSALGSVMHTILAVSNAINLATLANSGIDAERFRILEDISQKEREIRELESKGISGRLLEDARGDLNALRKELEEYDKKKVTQSFNDVITMIGALGSVATAGAVSIPRLIPQIKELATVIQTSFISTGVLAAAISLAAAFAAVFIAGFFLGQWLADTFIPTLGELEYFYYSNIEPMFANFEKTITDFVNIISPLWVDFWNGIIQVVNFAVNGVIKGMEGLVNGFIAAINSMISAYNRIASKLKLPKLSTLSAVTLPTLNIPLIGRGTGTNTGGVTFPSGVNEQTSPFLNVGANGGTTIVNNVVVQGSIVTENDIFKMIDGKLKELLKSIGFSGF